tara:strand:- start:2631 stop:2816 length:186 start_codon:yes stop_codon:yes gene_type:complete
MAKVTIDESTCVGCGLCSNACPEVFELKSDGIAIVKTHECGDHDLHDIASQCPVNCIQVED